GAKAGLDLLPAAKARCLSLDGLNGAVEVLCGALDAPGTAQDYAETLKHLRMALTAGRQLRLNRQRLTLILLRLGEITPVLSHKTEVMEAPCDIQALRRQLLPYRQRLTMVLLRLEEITPIPS